MTVISKVSKTDVSRRSVLMGMGATGGLLLTAPIFSNAVQAELMGKDMLSNSVYLAIDLDGTAHLYVHRVEMGQGSRTGLPQVIADELCADWDRIKLHAAYGDKKFGDQNTDGSTSIRKFYDTYRVAGATARHMLEAAAAKRWGVSMGDVAADSHKVKNSLTGDTLDYKDLVADASEMPVPAEADVRLKSRSEHSYIGKPKQNVYMKDFVTGSSEYGQDVRIEGMVYAVAARPPVVGGVLKSYDEAAARAVRGVIDVVELPAMELPAAFKPLGGVAVVAENTWAAIKGREALNPVWDDGPNADYDTAEYEKGLWKALDGPTEKYLTRGDAAKALTEAADVYEASYFVPHQHHIPMEPPAATAKWDGDDLTIWACVQDPQTVQNAVAPFVDKKPEDIKAVTTLLGGAFGRKSKPDFAVEAAIVSKKVGKPVKMVWTREDDVQHGFYHDISTQKVRAGLNADGKMTAYQHIVAYPPIAATFQNGAGHAGFQTGLGLLDIPFAAENLSIESGDAKAHVRIGWLRSVANIQQAFAVGSFVDELARKQGVKTDAMWHELIGSDRKINPADDGAQYSNYGESLDRHPVDTKRLKGALDRVVEMSGYGKRTLPEGHGIGISVHRSFVSYVACALEVQVIDGALKVVKGWMAIDCGLAVNPDRVKAQMEGAVIFGMSIALHGEITAKNGRIEQSNFDGYPVCRIDEAPDVEVSIIASDAPPGGVGEPGVPPVAAALANAIFDATGKRIRRLPIGDQLSA